MKWIIAFAFLGIAASMVSAMIFLIRDQGKTRNVVRALTVRISLSVVLFALIWFSYHMGWIEPTGIPMRPR